MLYAYALLSLISSPRSTCSKELKRIYTLLKKGALVNPPLECAGEEFLHGDVVEKDAA